MIKLNLPQKSSCIHHCKFHKFNNVYCLEEQLLMLWTLTQLHECIDQTGMDLFSGEITLSILSPFWKGIYSNRNELSPKESEICPVMVDPVGVQKKQPPSHKSCLPCKKRQQNLQVYSVTLKFLNLWHWPLVCTSGKIVSIDLYPSIINTTSNNISTISSEAITNICKA